MLDTSSGASRAIRQMLLQLAHRGWQVDVLGATVFDHPNGTSGFQGQWGAVREKQGSVVAVQDGPIQHKLLVTASTQREAMTSIEEGIWFALYEQILDQQKPDVLYYYGGQPFDYLIANEARRRGIPVAFYLANGNYHNTRWKDDIDLVLTDSQATADLYKERIGLNVQPLGTFIDPVQVVAPQHSRERLLFINPVPAKGAVWVVRLALWLEQHQPDLVLEVVESRGGWQDILRVTTRAMGHERDTLNNVVITPNSHDMRPIYSRAWLLLAPSLWWESAGRVIPEAMLNGIPVICTERGGMPEMVGSGGIVMRLNEKYYEQPWGVIPSEEEISQLGQCIVGLRQNPERYAQLVQEARRTCVLKHNMELNTDRLQSALQLLMSCHATRA